MPLPTDGVAWAIKAFKDERNARYDTFASYVAGDQPNALSTEKFRAAFGRYFEAFAYNRCEMVVDAHADRLRVEGIGADDETLAQQAQALWDANRMDLREGHAETDAFGLGDSHLIVEMHPERGDVQFWVQDPRTVRVHYADDVPGERDLAAKLWIDEDTKHARLNLYFRDRVEKYISTNRANTTPTSATAFERYTIEGEDQGFTLNVTDTVPVFHIANNGRINAYGHSEIANVLPLQDAINKTLMDLFVASEFMAFPQRVFMGIETATTEEDKAKLAQIEAGITRAITLEDPNAKIGEFSAANLQQYLSVLEFLDKAVSRVTKVPVHYLGMSGDFPSGRALRIAEAPFTAKLEDRTRAYGQVWSDALTYGLRLQGMTNVEPGMLRINWAPVEPSSEEDVWDLIMQKRGAGLALISALREAGYDPDQLDLLREEQDEEAQRSIASAQRAFDAGAVTPGLDDGEEGAAA